MCGATKPGILTPYKKEIDSMLEYGIMVSVIERKIRNAGYHGSGETVRHYIADWKRRRKHLIDQKSENQADVLERREVFKLLFNPLENVKNITQDNFDKLYAEYPCFQKIHSIVWEFRQLLVSKIPDNLNAWLKKAKKLGVREITSFVEGVRRDFSAVFNAIKFEYSNGLAEGVINKIKLIKRTMYGRQTFSTLKSKLLFRDCFN
jgi:transposase